MSISPKYDERHVSVKMHILDTAIQLYGMDVADFLNDKADHVGNIVKAAKQIEGYVFSDFQTTTSAVPAKSAKPDTVEDRQKFLDSLVYSGCGCGRDSCDGSESKCEC